MALATLHTPEVAALQQLTSASKRAYCERWGQVYLEISGTLDAARPPAWSKLLWIKMHLADFDWVWWLDADAQIMNPAIAVESLLDPVHDLIVSKARTKDPFGGHNINTGSFFIRNTSWAHAFLDRVYAQERFTEHICWEQAAICHLYETEPAVREKIRVDLDNTRYNSFASDYRKGHFVFHAVEPRRLSGAKEDLLRQMVAEDARIDFATEPEIRVLAMISEENCETFLQSTLASLARETAGHRSSAIEMINMRHADFEAVGGYAGLHLLWLQKVEETMKAHPDELVLVASEPVQFFTGWERALLVNLGKNDLLMSGLPASSDTRLILFGNSATVRSWFNKFVAGFRALPHWQQSNKEALSEYWRGALKDLQIGGFQPDVVSDQFQKLGIQIVNLKIQLPALGSTSAQNSANFVAVGQQRASCLASINDFLQEQNPGGFRAP